MQGKNQFSPEEASVIRRLLAEKKQADGSRQKAIRAALRRIRFYITDFDGSYQGFLLADFEGLIFTGIVSIR